MKKMKTERESSSNVFNVLIEIILQSLPLLHS